MIPESINLEFKANNRKRSKPLDIEASFLFSYFAKGMSKYNEDLSEYETKSDRRCRDWVLAFKDLSELGEESAKNLNELRIFKYIFSHILKENLKRSNLRKIALISVPSSKIRERNSVGLLISEVCKTSNILFDFSDLLIRTREVSSKDSDLKRKVLSLDINKSIYRKLCTINPNHILILDDVLTSGETLVSVCQKLFSTDLFFNGEVTVSAFAFGKTLRIDDVLKRGKIPNQQHGIYFPEIKNTINNVDLTKIRDSIAKHFIALLPKKEKASNNKINIDGILDNYHKPRRSLPSTDSHGNKYHHNKSYKDVKNVKYSNSFVGMKVSRRDSGITYIGSITKINSNDFTASFDDGKVLDYSFKS